MPKASKRQGKRSLAQKNSLKAIHETRGKEDKENEGISSYESPPFKVQDASKLLIECKKKLGNSQRKTRHLKTQTASLRTTISELKAKTIIDQRTIQLVERKCDRLQKEEIERGHRQQAEIDRNREALATAAANQRDSQKEIRKLGKQLARADKVREKMLQKARLQPSAFKQIHGRAYSPCARKLARIMVLSGCARSKVGPLLSRIAQEFGVPLKKSMSRRTVGRTVLEGLVGSYVQMGSEIDQSKALTISADSTSNRGVNFESRHIAMRAPDYQSGSLAIDPLSTPRNRLLCVDSTVDHTSETSVNGILKRVEEVMDTFNRSPFAERLKRKLSIRDFLRSLKGMNGDHASSEKSTANGMADRKRTAAIQELGEESLLAMPVHELMQYLGAWNQKKIADAGGMERWRELSTLKQAELDSKLMSEIVSTLGKAEYDLLPAEDRRRLDLFIWAGCCMHKDQNSFKGGNTEMMGAWAELGVEPPIILANKFNSVTLRRILDPSLPAPAGPLTGDEQQAFEMSTRGGVKTTALAGAILNNKDDKKGQGQKHVDYFREKVDDDYKHFPPTNQTRFGSHADAAGDLIEYLDDHISYLHLIRLSKVTGTHTHIEHNLLEALQDTATLTELCAMTLYSQTISKPYTICVRKPEAGNVLDLGPLHALVREHVMKIIENPDLLVCPDASPVDATLDGKDWNNPKAVAAVFALMPKLPYLKEITVAFFRGSLATWKRFSSEFAPGGVIDEASAEERHLAWMPATNDINEGALGAYRVKMREKPAMTLHQYNAMAMYQHNDTQAFMDITFNFDDYLFIMREARRIDAIGLEGERRKALVDFRVVVAEMRKEKEAARQAKLKADAERLSKVVLISQVEEIDTLTVAKLGDQIDALRHRGLPDVPVKSRFPKKAERQAVLKDLFLRYQTFLQTNGVLPGAVDPLLAGRPRISDDWEALEEAEMDED